MSNVEGFVKNAQTTGLRAQASKQAGAAELYHSSRSLQISSNDDSWSSLQLVSSLEHMADLVSDCS